MVNSTLNPASSSRGLVFWMNVVSLDVALEVTNCWPQGHSSICQLLTKSVWDVFDVELCHNLCFILSFPWQTCYFQLKNIFKLVNLYWIWHPPWYTGALLPLAIKNISYRLPFFFFRFILTLCRLYFAIKKTSPRSLKSLQVCENWSRYLHRTEIFSLLQAA